MWQNEKHRRQIATELYLQVHNDPQFFRRNWCATYLQNSASVYMAMRRQFPWNLTSLLCNNHPWQEKGRRDVLKQVLKSLSSYESLFLCDFEISFLLMKYTSSILHELLIVSKGPSKQRTDILNIVLNIAYWYFECFFFFPHIQYLWNKHRQIFTIQSNFQIMQVKQDKPASTLLKEGK